MNEINRKQLFKTSTYVFSYGATLIISFILTPFLIKTFGAETYSFYTIANNLSSYMMVICNALNVIACRYIAIEINKDNYTTANDYYKSVFVANITISVAMSFVMTMIVVFLERLFHVPYDYLHDIKLLFVFTFSSLLINVVFSIFSIATIARNRMDLRAYREILAAVLKLGLMYAFFALFIPRMYYIGIVILIVACFNSLIQIIYTKKLTPKLNIKAGVFRIHYIKRILIDGIWNTFNSLGGQLLTGLTIILVNAWIGASEASLLSIVHTPIGLLNGIITAIVTALYPRLLQTYAESEGSFSETAVRFQNILAVFTNVTVAGIIIMGESFYAIWVPSVNSRQLSIITILQLLPIFFIGNVHVFTQTNTLSLKIRIPAITLCGLAFLNVIGGFIISKVLRCSYMTVVTFNVILTSMYYCLFIPIYSRKNINIRLSRIYIILAKSILSVVISIGIGLIINTIWVVNKWGAFFAKVFVVGTFFLAINCLLILRVDIIHNLKRRIRE